MQVLCLLLRLLLEFVVLLLGFVIELWNLIMDQMICLIYYELVGFVRQLVHFFRHLILHVLYLPGKYFLRVLDLLVRLVLQVGQFVRHFVLHHGNLGGHLILQILEAAADVLLELWMLVQELIELLTRVHKAVQLRSDLWITQRHLIQLLHPLFVLCRVVDTRELLQIRGNSILELVGGCVEIAAFGRMVEECSCQIFILLVLGEEIVLLLLVLLLLLLELLIGLVLCKFHPHLLLLFKVDWLVYLSRADPSKEPHQSQGAHRKAESWIEE